MNSEIIVCIFIYICLSIMASIGLLKEFFDDPEEFCLSPRCLYENSEMNICGVLLVFVLLVICVPLYYLVVFLYWITHVGRRD